MKHWDMEQIKWDRFDPSLIDPKIVPLIKAASVVERNSVDYTVYLNNVFEHDAELRQLFQQWEVEEVQHGEVLGRWAMMADPSWNYQKSFDRFKEFYKIDLDTNSSIRGSHAGEFIARAMVEVGTSSYYSALVDYVKEPVLKEICRKIAGDEFRHYKLFYDCMKQYLPQDNLSKWARAKIAIGRIVESQDDELASAFHITNEPEGMPYNHKRCIALYMVNAMPLYQRHHVARVVNMVFKTIGWMPSMKLQEILAKVMMYIIKFQHKSYAKQIAGLV
ncbi:ferritin-like domain-containing protein [Commensalibacter nepenthis]|uniref:Ferritin-like domain-containing protein n=1 Tax=Commensalibacter nepenthis TaxID=3043872 RepID=A0ABT6Q9I2_9PROT|nr:ferritin-like domain-containing protein [Commensalibacter sp. TBRC 10068]MDI2112965.1 ferritin-like domain-containing protein [Commensalibacter sp. TBRC 10068]